MSAKLNSTRSGWEIIARPIGGPRPFDAQVRASVNKGDAQRNRQKRVSYCRPKVAGLAAVVSSVSESAGPK